MSKLNKLFDEKFQIMEDSDRAWRLIDQLRPRTRQKSVPYEITCQHRRIFNNDEKLRVICRRINAEEERLNKPILEWMAMNGKKLVT